jgi:hypothetical protein
MNKLNKWVNKNNFKLNIINTKIDEVDFDNKIININNNTNITSQIITILHECGHILIYLQRKKYKNKKIVGLSWYDWNKIFIKNRTLKNKISILEEEIESWNRGLKLAKKLNIKVKKKIYQYHRIRALKSYIKYVHNK